MSTFETALKCWWGSLKWWGSEALASFASSHFAPDKLSNTIKTNLASQKK